MALVRGRDVGDDGVGAKRSPPFQPASPSLSLSHSLPLTDPHTDPHNLPLTPPHTLPHTLPQISHHTVPYTFPHNDLHIIRHTPSVTPSLTHTPHALPSTLPHTLGDGGRVDKVVSVGSD